MAYWGQGAAGALYGEYNVLAYGAKGDGVTDDGPAFQAAGDAALAANGGTVVVPASPGAGYLLTTAVLYNMLGSVEWFSIRGVGAGSIILCDNPLANYGIRIAGSGTNRNKAYVADLAFLSRVIATVQIPLAFLNIPYPLAERLVFTNIQTAPGVIDVLTCGLVLRDTILNGCYGDSAQIYVKFAPYPVTIEDCLFNDATGSAPPAIYFDSPNAYPSFGVGNGTMTVRRCAFGEVPLQTIRADCASFPGGKFYNVVVEDCEFQQGAGQIVVAGAPTNSRSILADSIEKLHLRRNRYTWEAFPERIAIEASNIDSMEMTDESTDIVGRDSDGYSSNRILVHSSVQSLKVSDSIYRTFFVDAPNTEVEVLGVNGRLRVAAATILPNTLVKIGASDGQVDQLGIADSPHLATGVALEGTAFGKTYITCLAPGSIPADHYFDLYDDTFTLFRFQYIFGAGPPIGYQIDISGAVTDADVATLTAAVINGVGFGVTATANVPAAGMVTVSANVIGEEWNVINDNGNLPSNFIVTPMTGGRKRIRVGETTGKQYPLLSDGTAIAVADPITSSGATAGFIKKNAGAADLTVGQAMSAPIAGVAWQASTFYNEGQSVLVTNDGGKLYLCLVSGVSASAGGPTGTGQDILDGTARWIYVGQQLVNVLLK